MIFFVTLAPLLFLGDGKRSVVEVVATAVVLILAVVTHMKKSIRAPGGGVMAWWAFLLMYLLVRLPFSDSVAYSIYATVRYLVGFIIFVLFANNLMDAKAFARGVIDLTLTAVCLSAVVFFVPPVRTWMPEMSLLSNAYGHHHISYLLIFALPFTLRDFFTKKSLLNGLIAILFFVVLVLTRARAAWFMAAIYAFFLLTQNVALGKKWRLELGAVFIGLFVLFVSTSTVPKLFQYIKTGAPVREKTDLASARFGYWQQAVDAFKDRPVFGTGLGTFYLSSLRYQAAPQTYSWLAHSFPLQTLSEIGVFGIIGVIGIIWAVGKRALRRYGDERQPLIEAVALAGLYSLVDITQDYLVIWILVWAALGLLYGLEQTSNQKAWMLYGAIGILAVFYVVSIGAEAGQLITRNKILLQPFNTQRALAYLDSRTSDTSLTQRQLEIILWFHRKNPEVLAAAQYYEKAEELDPQNVKYFADYISFLVEQKKYNEIAQALTIDSTLSPLLTKDFLADVGRPSDKNEYLAKLYYFVGLSALVNSPEQTKELWTRARDLAPDWGYFHVELASLENIVFHNLGQAKKILINCQNNLFASAQCNKAEIMNALPGDQYENIKAIPTTKKN